MRNSTHILREMNHRPPVVGIPAAFDLAGDVRAVTSAPAPVELSPGAAVATRLCTIRKTKETDEGDAADSAPSPGSR
jgi:hypothetical protein